MPSFSPVGYVMPVLEHDHEHFPAGHYRGRGGDQRGTGGNPWALPDVRADWMRRPGESREQRRRMPKNYQPSDHRIYEDVVDMLSDHGDIDIYDIEIVVNDGDVTLRGTVRSRYARFYAEDLAAQAPGVKDIINELRIERTPDGRERGGPTSDAGGPGSLSSHR